MSELREAVVRAFEDTLERALGEGRRHLFEHEIYHLLAEAGFRVPRSFFVRERREIDRLPLGELPGARAVCKLISPGMPHRTEHGGIRFVDAKATTLAAVFDDFGAIASRAKVEFSGLMIAELVPGTDAVPYQLLVSMRQDPAFGPVVFCGLGGVGTELYQRSMLPEKGLRARAASLVHDRRSTEEAMLGTFLYPVVTGRTRMSAKPLIEGAKLLDALDAFALIGERYSPRSRDSRFTIEEIEINPFQITPDGALVPLDALLRFSDAKNDDIPAPMLLIERLLDPRSALVIGASANKMNMGRIILRNLISGGGVPREHIYLLHPEAAEIDGCRAFKALSDIPENPDMTVFTVPADEKGTALLDELVGEARTSSITLISGGFGETERGRELERRLRERIRDSRKKPGGGVAVNGPNCMGIVSKPGGYNTFFLPEYKLPFRGAYGERSAIISQSGAYVVTLVSNLDRVINPKYMITFGNQIDVTVSDYLLALKDDPGVDLYIVYIEGFKPYDGERFLAAAREIVAKGKNVLLFKAGRTEAGAAAVASHTAAMAGDFAIMRRLLGDAGVIVAESLDEMEDLIKVFVLLGDKKPRGERVGIFSNAGFECSVAADSLGSLTLARFSEETSRRLHEALPTGIIDVHNPVDATPQTNAVNYGRCLEAILADDGVDCLMAANVAPTPFMENLPAGEGHKEDIAHENSYPNVTIRLFKGTSKPMVVSLNSGALFDPAARMIEDAGIPMYRKIDRAMKALETYVQGGRPKGR